MRQASEGISTMRYVQNCTIREGTRSTSIIVSFDAWLVSPITVAKTKTGDPLVFYRTINGGGFLTSWEGFSIPAKHRMSTTGSRLAPSARREKGIVMISVMLINI